MAGMKRAAVVAGMMLAGCLPQDLPPGEPPIPYSQRTPCLSDFEMDHAKDDMTETARSYLDERKFGYSDLKVYVWPNLGVAVRVVTPTPEDEKIGMGLVHRLDRLYNHEAYLYRPTGYDYIFKVVLAKP